MFRENVDDHVCTGRSRLARVSPSRSRFQAGTRACTRVLLPLRGHARKGREKQEAGGENEVERRRKDRPCPREDRLLEATGPEEKLAGTTTTLFNALVPLYSHEALAGYKEQIETGKKLIDFYELLDEESTKMI